MEKNLAHNLKFLRKYHAYTIIEIAEKFGVSKSAISDYENLKNSPPILLIEKYCKHFKVSISSIVKYKFDTSKLEAGTYIDSDVHHKQNKNLRSKQVLMEQKIDSLQLQIKLLNQLIESKDSEIKTLKMQIILNKR
jgi:transcriptional regulator with XRE-family HTH domain